MKWIKCLDRMPVIDPAKPTYYLFKHWDNVRVMNIWTEFIRDFPPMITVHKIEWVWLDESTPPEKTYSKEEIMQLLGAFKISEIYPLSYTDKLENWFKCKL